MTMLWSRLRALVHRLRRPASWERALHEEVQSYVDLEIDARIQTGMSPAEARRTALAEFGGVEQVKERVRTGGAGAWLDTLRQDLRYACRALQHSRGFTAWVVGSLAIGMAVTIAALAVLNAMLMGPFPEVADQHRLVRVSVSRNCGRPDCWIPMSSPADYAGLREGLTGLQGLAAYTARGDRGRSAGSAVDARHVDDGGLFRRAGRAPRRRPCCSMRATPRRRPRSPSSPTAPGSGSSAPTRRRSGDRYAWPIGSCRSSGWRPSSSAASIGSGPAVAVRISGFRYGWRIASCRSRSPSSAARSATLAFVGRLKDDVDVRHLQAEAEVVAQAARRIERSRIAPRSGRRAAASGG